MIDATDLNCDCTAKVLCRRVYTNGSTHWLYQCITCGLHGQSIKAEVAQSRIAAGEKFEAYDEERSARYRAMLRERQSRDRHDLKQQRLEEYNAYLNSPEWKEKRRRVIDRAGGLCEGCRSQLPSQVHHLTYDNAGDELLFQLVALCDDCHAKAHHG